MSDDLFNDRFVIQSRIAERDFVTRSIALDRILGRQVLVTQLRGRIGRRAATQQRFRAAAEKSARLSHHNIIALFEVSSANGLPYIVQEYAHSELLSEIIAHEGPFHPDDVAILVEQIADALDYADQRGLNHLALRPDNVVVDYDGVVLVSDFAIGKVIDELGEQPPDSIQYKAPDLAIDGEGDRRADVFSLGVIAYQMLTGQLPYDPHSTDDLLEQKQRGALIAPSIVNQDVPPAISGILLAALSGVPEYRFQTAGEFAYALTNWRDAQVDPGTMRMGTSSPSRSLNAGPDPDVSLETVDPGDDREEIGSSRLMGILAWSAVAAGLIALAWIAIILLDTTANEGRPNITRVAETSVAEGTRAVANQTEPIAVVPTAAVLIGSLVEEAAAITDIPVRVVSTESSDSFPAGQIIRQFPNPGDLVRNSEFVVVVSAGASPIQLASFDAANMDFDELANMLTAKGLNVTQVEEGSATIPEGLVVRIEQTAANPGDDVTVVVSMGDRVQIPYELQSQPLANVVDRLEKLGLDVADPRPVPAARITEQGYQLADFDIVDGDVVGIQEDNAGFGNWIDNGSTVTPVYYSANLDG